MRHPWLRRSIPLISVLVLVVGCSSGGTTSPPNSVVETTPVEVTQSSPAVTDVAVAESPEPQGVEPVATEDIDVLPVLEDVVAEWAPATRTEELLLAIDEAGGVSLQTAVDAVALTVPGFPGASSTSLPPGEGLSPSLLLSIIDDVRPRLDPAQLDALASIEGPPGESFEIAIDGSVVGAAGSVGDTVAAPGSTAPTAGGGEVPTSAAGFTGPRQGFRATLGAPMRSLMAFRRAEPDLNRYRDTAQAVWKAWKAYRPAYAMPPIVVEFPSFQVATHDMDTHPHPDDPDKCRIRVFPQIRALDPDENYLKELFAHELFHCMQFVWAGGTLAGIQDWIIEGGAAFASYDLFRASHIPVDRSLYDAWFTVPNAPLGARTYSAWPFFESFRYAGGDALGALEKMLRQRTPDVESALYAGDMRDVRFRALWSSLSLRSSTFLEQEWVMPWPGVNPSLGPRDTQRPYGTRGIGTYEVKATGEYGHPQLAVAIAPEVGILAAVPSTTMMLTHAATGTVTLAEQKLGRFCFDEGGCACPEGMTSDTIPMAGRTMLFSFPATRTVPSAQVKAVKFDPEKHCSKRKPVTASSNGDPHLVSFDGMAFDVMAPGEFVLTRDPSTGFEVQTRHVPLANGAASTTAVAIRVGTKRITLTLPAPASDDEPSIRVDGSPVVIPAGGLDIGDATIAGAAEDWQVTLADGDQVHLHDTLGWFVTVSLDAARAGRAQGLLGGYNLNALDDLRIPDGSILAPGSDLDTTFAAAWQVSEETSLFDYAPGESLAGFRDARPPVAVPAPPSGDEEAACRERLGEAATSVEVAACSFDLAATGDDSFLDGYAQVVARRVESSRDEAFSPEGPFVRTGNGTDPGVAIGPGRAALVLSGRLSPTAGSPTELSGSITAVANTVVVVRAARCDQDADLYVQFDGRGEDPASGFVAACDPFGTSAALADADDDVVEGEAAVWLPRGGVYDVSLWSTAADERFVEVELFTDTTPTLLDDGALVAGGLEDTLDGIADTVVATADSGGESVTWSATGLDVACGGPAFGAPAPGDRAVPVVWPLAPCPHAGEITLTPTAGTAVTFVLYARTATPTTVSLVRRP